MSATTMAWVIGALAVSVLAQDRPGIDRPIRVGSFLGTGPGRYWVASTQSGNAALGVMLANPESAGLGPDLVIPPKGFSFTKFGVTCENCSPSVTQTEAFINALDTLDVAYIGSFVALGSIISTDAHRTRLRDFMTTKAYVGVSRVTDSYALWPALDSIHGVRFEAHPPSDRNATLRRDSVAENDADWRYLNRNLFHNGLDTVFRETWFTWGGKGSAIRAGNPLGSMIITVKILEETYEGGLGGTLPMGDHPMSWGRRMAAGGRVFYTAVGHRVDNYLGGRQKPRFLRRQIYNAILWAAKYDSLSGATGIMPRRQGAAATSADYRIEAFPSSLKVTLLTEGNHSLELIGIDGRRFGRRDGRGETGAGYVFENLRPGVYALAVTARHGRATRLVVVP